MERSHKTGDPATIMDEEPYYDALESEYGLIWEFMRVLDGRRLYIGFFCQELTSEIFILWETHFIF